MNKTINDLKNNDSNVLDYTQLKFYIFTLVFSIGNFILPTLFHFIPNGGKMFLPIFFFTLVGASLYGWQFGVTTALISITGSYLVKGMPVYNMVYIVLLKSIVIAIAANFIKSRYSKFSLLSLLLIVLSYQLFGFFLEIIYFDDISNVINNYYISIPGMLMQIILGYFIIKKVEKYEL